MRCASGWTQQVAARQLTAGEVIAAIREQNIQVSPASWAPSPVRKKVRQAAVHQCARRLEDGRGVRRHRAQERQKAVQVVRLADVARIELGASDYTLRSWSDTKNMAAVGIFLSPGAECAGRGRG